MGLPKVAGVGPLRLLIVLVLVFLLYPSRSFAMLPYETRFLDQQLGRSMIIQPLYVPSRVIGFQGLDVPLSSPDDLFIPGNNHVFIADSGNNRIVELDDEGRFIRKFGSDEGIGNLSQPEGVYVANDGKVYVADTGNKRIAVFNSDGTFLRGYEKPSSPRLPADYYFVPSKLVVDARGVMYIDVKGSYEGLLRMGPDGSFQGFFGANKTPLSWLDHMKRLILSKKQLEKEAAKEPGSIENVTLMNNGFLVTTNGGVDSGQIRKLGMGGVDNFGNKSFSQHQLVDVAADPDGFLYGIDMELGEVTIFDPRGDALFFFGDTDPSAHQYGIVSYPSSVAINGKKELWIADSKTNLIQVLKRTAFGDTFMTAAHFYYEGNYEKSKPYWEEVMKQNGMINLSFDAMGKIALNEKQYETAIGDFKDSYDAKGYSDAFWNIRYQWIQNNLLYLAIVAAAGIWLVRVAVRRWKVILKKHEWPAYMKRYGGDAKDALFLMFHPYEGFYRLKERKVSWLFLLTLAGLVAVIRIVSLYRMGFVFHPFDLSRVNVAVEMGLLFIPWATWIIANYLVSAVKGGEGRFREVLQASAYAIVPYIVLMIPVLVLSNIVVLEETVMVNAIRNVMLLWVLMLFFIMTQVIHNFDFIETIKNTCIMLFTIGVIWILAIILSGLGYNLYDFLLQIYREVTFHG